MKNLYLMIVMVVLFFSGAAQEKKTFDLNGDIIPQAALIASDLQSPVTVVGSGNPEMRSEWTAKGPWGGNLRGFATNVSDNMNVVAACGHSTAGNGGIWYSEDGGQTWNGSDINNKVMYAAFAHPSEAGVFYAGGKYGIYESTDGGATWLQIAYPSTTIIGLGINPVNTDLMIAGIASNQGVRYSADGGDTWNSTNLTQGFMKDFGVSPDNPEQMYVAVSGSNGSGLYTSTDGAAWTAVNPAGSGQCYGVYVDPDNADFLLLAAENGIFKSVNGAADWVQVLSTSNFARSVVKFDGKFYSAVYGGAIYESADAGDNWTIADEEIVERTWQAMGVSGAGVLFGSWGSVVLGDGSSYALSVQGMNNVYVHNTVYYADRNELWAGSEGSGIWVSYDMGETWVNKSNGLQGWWAYTFAPTNHEDWEVGRMMVGTNNGVYYSDDFGENWVLLDQETTYYTGAMVHWTNPDIMWVGGATGPVKYTTDGGANWLSSAGLPFAFYPRFSLCYNDSQEPRVLLIYEQLGTTSYYSDDLGANYTASTGFTAVSYFTDLSIRMADGSLYQMVYMSTDKGIYQSPDGAEYTICPNLNGLCWSVLGSNGTDVYAGANNGIFYSADEGQNWEAFNTGIENIAIWDINYGSSADVLYAGTRGYSVYKYGEDAPPSYALPFVEDFTGQQLPADWQNVDNAGSTQVWQFDNPGGRDITGAGFDADFAILDSDEYGSGSAQDADLISPPIDCSGASNIVVKFDQSFRQYQTSVGTLSVSSNGTDWEAVYTVEENTGYPNPAVTQVVNISDVAANQPTVWLKWNYVGEWEYWWAIDNVMVMEELVVLDPPVNLQAVVDLTNVTLSWEAPPADELTGYNVYRDGEMINTALVTELSYLDEDVAAGTHVYAVTAVYDLGESGFSNQVQVEIDGTLGKIQGFVRDLVTNQVIPEATVTATNIDNGAVTYTTPFGSHYSMLVPEGTYDLVCMADGYQDGTASGIYVEAGGSRGYTFYLQQVENETLTGILSINAAENQVYPNPADAIITINGNDILKCEILDQSGRSLVTLQDIHGEQTINIGHLASGVYFVRITTTQGVNLQKLVVE